LAAYGVTGLNLETLEATRQELEQRRRQREETTSLKREQEKRHDALVVQTRLQAEQIAKQTQELQEKRLELDRRQQERNALATQRQELFDDRNTEAEEQRLAYEVASAEKDEKNADNALTTARLHLQDLTTRINELRQTSATGRDKAAAAAAEFTARLAAAGFEQEQDYLTARLPETERRQLANRAGELNDRKTILENQTRDLQRQLAEEQAKNITAETPENLQALINDKQAACQSIQQDIGAIRQKLQENDERQRRLQEKLQAVAKQKSEYERWGQLDGLIGSADGKKYRNFAQGLTFDIMIRHANVQLQKLTDRYLLLRNETNPLELDVVDNYQAGEVRSTKNLSGGESFIVSLALALGLAHMASRNIRVDSLFLDEGFGTLDDDALDTALEALSSLQHDGKLIGIISHVAAIKDRIGAQILVTPTTGGKSRITGPGCQKTAPAR
jgi:exonuclease SbcC